MLDLDWCRKRQDRLLAIINRHGLDAAILMNPKTVHYFTGSLVDTALPQAFAIDADGDSLLVTNRQPEQTAASEVVIYTAYTIQRLFSRASMHEELVSTLAGWYTGQSLGLEFDFATFGAGWELAEEPTDLTPDLQRIRRHKDPDELAAMRRTIAITEAAYAAIKPRLAPGMTEYQVYSIAAEAMTAEAQTSLHISGDFASGVRGIHGGGPPTGRRLERGDLYILDLFPLYQGYMADLCRTFVVGEATSLQRETWEHVAAGHEVLRSLIRPGARACEIYRALRQHLDAFGRFRGSFTHHAGHGLGMDGWEYPWLTPSSDQTLQEGEVIACEPGLYGEELRGGIRLEHNYLVTAEGPVALDSFSFDL